MKQFYLAILAICFSIVLQAQIVGGRNNSQSAPKEVKPAEVTAGSYRGDVSLQSGSFQSNYDLGTVSTPSGLSFNLRLNYSSAFSGGDNVPVASGIPYGEGWSLGLPTITVSTDAWRKYAPEDIDSLNNDNNVNTYPKFSALEAAQEGRLYWMSPYITIPGLISGRFVYKYLDTVLNEAVFVPNAFESYVEARFTGDMWKVIAPSGVVYEFGTAQKGVRNASNQRVYEDSLQNDILQVKYNKINYYFIDTQNYSDTIQAHVNGSTIVYNYKKRIWDSNSYNLPQTALENLIMPKTEILMWYCDEINHPNSTFQQRIVFKYGKYGEFNYFQEYSEQPFTKFAIQMAFNRVGVPDFKTYKDIVLLSVEATDLNNTIDKIELNYKTLHTNSMSTPYPVNGVPFNMLLINDNGVSRKDSLYNYKTVYSSGLEAGTEAYLLKTSASQDANFFGWKKYHHLKNAAAIQISGGGGVYNISSNPYKGSIGGGSEHYYRTSAYGFSNINFSHSFLESPRIVSDPANTSIPLPAGDLYELRTLLHTTNTGSNAYCNFDINIVSGSYIGQPNVDVENPSGSGKIEAGSFVNPRSYSVFTTYNQAVKWNTVNTRNDAGGVRPQNDSVGLRPYLTTSNIFVMPNLPSQFNGFHIQIGPGNSDHDFKRSMPDVVVNYTPYSSLAYYNQYIYGPQADKNRALRSFDPVPNHFGIGMDWHMLRFFTKYMDDYDSSYHATRHRFWWNDGLSPSTYTHPNRPTAADDNVSLRGVALIRYSKNPWMLQSVKHYKVNGLVHNNTYALGAPTGLILTDQQNLYYQLVFDSIMNNRIYSAGQATENNGYRNVFLLKSIKRIPVNPSMNNNPPAVVDTAKVLTTHLVYTKFINPFRQLGFGPVSNSLRTNTNSYALTQYIDNLGGVTTITYYPLNAPETQFSASYTGSSSFVAGVVTNIGPSGAISFNLAVKSKTVNGESGNTVPKQWDYTYSEPVYRNKKLDLGKHFLRRDQNWEHGFKQTTVKEPELTSGGARSYKKYFHYGNDNTNLWFGKLFKTETYDGQNLLLDSKQTDYLLDTAYANACYLFNHQFAYTHEDDEYFWGGTSLASSKAVSGAGQTGYQAPLFVEGVYTHYFPAYYLNSHFIATKKETTTQYEYTQFSSGFIGSLPASYTTGFAAAISNNYAATNCSGIPVPTITSKSISHIVEYQWWQANYNGITACVGYQKLKGNTGNGKHQLVYEPSWQLYSSKSYSPQLPDAYQLKEAFFFFDLRNKEPYLSGKIAQTFDALALSHKFHMRDIAYENRGTGKAPGLNPVTTTEYTWYDAKWTDTTYAKTQQLPVVNRNYFGPTTCPPGYVGAAQAPPNNPGGTPGGYVNVGYWLQNRLFYRSTTIQIDTIALDSFNTTPHTTPDRVLTFVPASTMTNNGPLNYYRPMYPYDHYEVHQVEARNMYGQVEVEHDQKGLRTRLWYTPVQPINFVNVNTPGSTCNNVTATEHFDIAVPRAITVGYGLADSLRTLVRYNPDYSIDSIIDPNGKVQSYTYDDYGRMKEAFVNNKRIVLNNYHNWENNHSKTFEQRAEENYVESFLFNDSAAVKAQRSRAYVDPLGRKFGLMTQICANINSLTLDTQMVYSGQTDYDNWNRAIKQYKPFLHRNGNGSTVAFSNRFNYQSANYPQEIMQSQYENNLRSRVLRSAPYGENISNGHVQQKAYSIVNGTALQLECQLSSTEVNLLMPGGSGQQNQYLFVKTVSSDEDNKRTITFTNAAGQQVALKQYLGIPNGGSIINNMIVTLFSYDSRGNLARVINPEKQQSIYKYNMQGQVYEKQTVDGGITRCMYNQSGQIVLEEDANARMGRDEPANIPYIRVYAYDAFGRMVKQDRYRHWNNGTIATGVNPLYYRDTTYSSSIIYTMTNKQTLSYGFKIIMQTPKTDPLSLLSNTITPEKSWKYHNAADTVTVPLATVFKQQLKNKPQTFTKGQLSQCVAYNHAGSPIQVQVFSYNKDLRPTRHLTQFSSKGITAGNLGTCAMTKYTYNLQGAVLTEILDVGITGNTTTSHTFAYDDYSRMKQVDFNADSKGLRAIYDFDLAQGLLKRIRYKDNICNSAVFDSVIYTYDLRNRMTKTQSRFFDEELFYDNAHPQGSTIDGNRVAADMNFNGNINGAKFTYRCTTATNNPSIFNYDKPTIYGYTYDGINRLTNADASVMENLYNQTGSGFVAARSFGDEGITYDKVGNITYLTRGRYIAANSTFQVDNWNYVYQAGTNRLLHVDSSGAALRTYTYDNSGNLRTDSYRKLTTTTYARANLPISIKVNNKTTNYAYDINDQRICKMDSANNQKEFYLKDISGRDLGICDTSGAWTWYAYGHTNIGKLLYEDLSVFVKDHLGSNRITYKVSGCGSVFTLNHVVDYYAYGKTLREFISGTTKEKFGYQGSERNPEIADNDYYTLFRGLDVEIARWKQIDPKPNFSQSSYISMSGNPIKFNDVLGDTVALFTPDGYFLRFEDDGKKEWSGRIYTKESVSYFKVGNVEYAKHTYSKGINFKFNDANIVDIPAIKCGIINKITIVDAAFIDKQMQKAFPPGTDLTKMNFAEKIAYFLEQGKAGKNLDLGPAICAAGGRSQLFLIDNKAYNVADLGNFLIGHAAAKADLPLMLMQVGGQYNHITCGKGDVNACYDLNCAGKGTYSPGFFDSDADQQAINDGYYYK